MFRFYGGQTVKKGTYWNLSGGESISVENQEALPGDRRTRYLKAPTAGMFILGPVFGLLFVCLIPLMSFLIGITMLSRIALASDALKSDEAQMCMGCHSNEGVVKTLKNKEKISVTLNENHFKDTVHGFLTCTNCHSSVSLDNHPSAQYSSKKDFAAQVSKACRTCHSDAQLFVKSLHKHAITKANAPPCSDCHGAHSIKKVSGWKEKAANSQYCLTCHKQELSISMKGETLSLSIDEATLRRSVHSNHNCSDCHDSYSKKEHPIKGFGSKRELSVTISDLCRRCHSEKYRQFQGSIHFNMLSKGNLKAPVCTDCHGAHSVGPKGMAETISGVPCKKCHESTFETYKHSVHGSAKISGKKVAPICSDCHFAHDVKPAFASRSPKTACLNCHKNVLAVHKEWLPNAEIHFDAVACTACHVPDAKRSVYLRLTDQSSGKTISDSKFSSLLGTSHTGAQQIGIEGDMLLDIYQKLNTKGTDTHMVGTLGLQDCRQSHQLAPKNKAIKECDRCHDANSEFFKAVTMTVVTPEGQEKTYNVNPAVLSSILTVLPLNQFYALGGTRIKLLDILGILMVVGGMSVPIAHITLRILTSPIREARRLNKLRKEGKR